MRKVTARELYRMDVKGGPDIPLSDEDKVALAKAKICSELEAVHGTDFQMWIRILKRAKQRIKKEPYQTAIRQLLVELEARERGPRT